MMRLLRSLVGSPRTPEPALDEMDCPGHVASALDAKVCARCGTHIDSLRPDDDVSESNPPDIEARDVAVATAALTLMF